MLGQRLDQLKARHQVRPQPGGIVGVDRDPGDHRSASARPPATAQREPSGVAADLDDPGDAHLGRPAERILGRQAGVACGGVQVAMGVHHRHRQWLGELGQVHAPTVASPGFASSVGHFGL